ncbi:hypothetical protein C8046_17145 [Serinibacter arcticus]|uniref:Integral membrane protein n=1 Tax=Serinibacter arcticus TaxID=1655435 RepID=A0A2U1ZYP8_9MICO|nr:hypothetical protein [Serinibacter arcticus]PWD52109.1 hypothetical protein C8046_17145 [Serinibacter arcticus]
MTSIPAAETAHPSQAPRAETGRRSSAVWFLATVAVTGLLATIPLLFNPRFYYADDTQAGAYPIWVSIGDSIRAGELPFFEPDRWMAGNLVAEGQWGTFNPLIWLVGLGATVVTHGALYSAIVKIAFLAIAAGGVFVLLRQLGARPAWALVGGVVGAGSGFTVYIDAASWVTSLFVWALLPWALWGLRAVGVHRRSVLLSFVPGFLLVTVGYVHGTLMLVVAVVGVMLEVALRRDWRALGRTVVAGGLLGLVALAVYLPGVLSSGVTARDSDKIENTNFMSPDLSGLGSAAAPTAQPWLTGFWGTPVGAPLMYVAWLLPLAVLVDWRRARALTPSLVAVLVVGGGAAVLAFGPSDMGPLRFPARVLPYLSVVLVVVVVLLLSRAGRRPTVRLGVLAALWLLISSFLGYAEAPEQVQILVIGSVVALLGIGGVMVVLSRSRSQTALAGVAVAATALVVVVQHHFFPYSPLPDFGLPSDREASRSVLAEARGDAMVLGDPMQTEIDWSRTSFANAWLLSDATVTNVYSPLMHRAYAEDLCVDSHGMVCWETATHLLGTDEATGLPLVDLLSLSTLQVLARPDGGEPGVEASDPYTFLPVPEGWSEVQRDDFSALWVRDEPVAGAGGVVWASEGTEISASTTTSTSVTLDVADVPAEGGSVVLSRLDWPGYTVDGGTVGESTRDYLLTVEIPPTSAGSTVVVTFSPPGWSVSVMAVGAAVLGAVVLAVLPLVRRRRD